MYSMHFPDISAAQFISAAFSTRPTRASKQTNFRYRFVRAWEKRAARYRPAEKSSDPKFFLDNTASTMRGLSKFFLVALRREEPGSSKFRQRAPLERRKIFRHFCCQDIYITIQRNPSLASEERLCTYATLLEIVPRETPIYYK